ncbi:MAG: high-affinity branched-chain amino acid ABC transporter permease LivM [Gammaproteobacteria bacterium]|nr:MAG: high-affinity branched-chain amino acid ABC transporter permease LivM [Gammaproteobacteria bacterium]
MSNNNKLGQSIQKNFSYAVSSAILTLLLTLPILGVRLEQDANGLALTGSFMYSVYAALAVFVAQLVLPVMRHSASYIPEPLHLAKHMETHRNWVLGILIVLGFILPFVASRGTIDIATLALIYVMLGLGLNVVVGYAGLLDLGYVGFYAVGAYTYAILSTQYGMGFWTCLPISACLAGLAGIILGFPVLRLRGDYLAIVTLGFGEIIRLLLNNLDQYTNGPNGIDDIPAPTLFNIAFVKRPDEGLTAFHKFFDIKYSSEYRMIFVYFVIFALVLLTLFVVNRLLRMPVGRAWEALREDEIACKSLGLNLTLIKLSAFAIGAFFAGIAGAFFAAKQGFINPESFTFIESAIILAIVVLGGMGSQIGVILAAIALTVIPEMARDFSEFRMIIFGAVMVLMMIWRPQGLIPAQRRKVQLPAKLAQSEGQ